MKKILLIFAIAIFITVTVTAQRNISLSKPIKEFSINLGGVFYQLRENIIAPLRWEGFGFNLDLSYSIIAKKGLHNIELGIPVAFPNNRYDHSSIVTEINLSYGYLYKIASNESFGKLYLGGMIDWSFNFQYYLNWDDSHIYWLNAYELRPAFRWSNVLGDKHQFAANFNFPLLALVSRPSEYRYIDQERLPRKVFSMPHEEMKFTSIHKYLSFGLLCEYMYQINEKFALGASYLLNYKSFSEPQPITIFSNSLRLKLLFRH